MCDKKIHWLPYWEYNRRGDKKDEVGVKNQGQQLSMISRKEACMRERKAMNGI